MYYEPIQRTFLQLLHRDDQCLYCDCGCGCMSQEHFHLGRALQQGFLGDLNGFLFLFEDFRSPELDTK